MSCIAGLGFIAGCDTYETDLYDPDRVDEGCPIGSGPQFIDGRFHLRAGTDTARGLRGDLCFEGHYSNSTVHGTWLDEVGCGRGTEAWVVDESTGRLRASWTDDLCPRGTATEGSYSSLRPCDENDGIYLAQDGRLHSHEDPSLCLATFETHSAKFRSCDHPGVRTWIVEPVVADPGGVQMHSAPLHLREIGSDGTCFDGDPGSGRVGQRECDDTTKTWVATPELKAGWTTNMCVAVVDDQEVVEGAVVKLKSCDGTEQAKKLFFDSDGRFRSYGDRELCLYTAGPQGESTLEPCSTGTLSWELLRDTDAEGCNLPFPLCSSAPTQALQTVRASSESDFMHTLFNHASGSLVDGTFDAASDAITLETDYDTGNEVATLRLSNDWATTSVIHNTIVVEASAPLREWNWFNTDFFLHSAGYVWSNGRWVNHYYPVTQYAESHPEASPYAGKYYYAIILDGAVSPDPFLASMTSKTPGTTVRFFSKTTYLPDGTPMSSY